MPVKKIECLSETKDIDFKDCLFVEEPSDNIKKWIRYMVCYMKGAEDIKNYTEYMKKVNSLIEDRGNLITDFVRGKEKNLQ